MLPDFSQFARYPIVAKSYIFRYHVERTFACFSAQVDPGNYARTLCFRYLPVDAKFVSCRQADSLQSASVRCRRLWDRK